MLIIIIGEKGERENGEKENRFSDGSANRIRLLNLPVLNSMEDWVRVVDRDGTVLFINDSMISALEKWEYEDVEQFLHFDDVSRVAFTTGDSIVKEESIGGRYFSVKSSPIFGGGGEVIAAVEVFRDMTSEINIKRELFNANRKMLDDLKFARRIQRSILPNTNAFNNISIQYRYMPSTDLSGDLFDVLLIDEHHIGVYICDVCGHGVTASLLTMFVKQVFRDIVSSTNSLSTAETVTLLRERYNELDLSAEQYITLYYMIIDTRTNELTCTNAGHNCAPIVFGDDCYETLYTTGFPITGALPGDYTEERCALDCGKKILFYTDGDGSSKFARTIR